MVGVRGVSGLGDRGIHNAFRVQGFGISCWSPGLRVYGSELLGIMACGLEGLVGSGI